MITVTDPDLFISKQSGEKIKGDKLYAGKEIPRQVPKDMDAE